MSEEEQSAAPEPAPENPTPAPGGQIPGAEQKVLSGILAIIFGCLGVHKFILGYQKEGIIMLAVTVGVSVLGSFVCMPFAGWMVMGIIGLIEGIIYLTKSDQEFVDTYVKGNKPWF